MRKTRPSCEQTGILHALGLARRGKCGKSGGLKRQRSRRVFFEHLEQRTLLSLCVWDGGGNNNHWSNPANWWAGLVPDANDDLVFRGTALTQTENDLPSGTAFRSLSFLSNDFSVAGNSLAVTNRIFVGPGASETTIAAEVGLNGTVHATLVGGSLLLSGGVSGSGSLSEDGIGILILGAGATYTGTTMIQHGATLQLGASDEIGRAHV